MVVLDPGGVPEQPDDRSCPAPRGGGGPSSVDEVRRRRRRRARGCGRSGRSGGRRCPWDEPTRRGPDGRQARLGRPYLKCPPPIRAHWCCGNRGAVTGHDQPTRERVVRSVLVNGPSTAAALAERLAADARRRTPPPRPADRRGHPRGPRAPHHRRPRTRSAGQGVRADRGGSRPASTRPTTTSPSRRSASSPRPGARRPSAQFADRRAAKIEQRFHAVRRRPSPSSTPAEALAQVFTAEGYAAAVRDSPVGEQLCQQHCPVSHVAHEFPELCEAETAAISRMLGRHVQRLATIAHGDGVCTTCIPDMVRQAPPPRRRRGSLDDFDRRAEPVAQGHRPLRVRLVRQERRRRQRARVGSTRTSCATSPR